MDQTLRVFVTVVEKENFTRAADALHMTQPAVSQYIQALERDMGTKLLERSNKYVKLNEAGEIVYRHAVEILALYTRMQTLVDDKMNKASGKIWIGASYTFGEYILPHMVAYLQAHYPLITPKITIANTRRISDWVANRYMDIGIIEGEFLQGGLTAEAFADDLMYVVASPETAAALEKEKNMIRGLAEVTWIVREEKSGTREATERMFSELNFRPKHMMEFGSTQIIKESVQAGLGVTLLSHCAIQKETSLGSLVILPVPEKPFQRKFSLIMSGTTFQTKATLVLMEMLRTHQGFPGFFGKGMRE